MKFRHNTRNLFLAVFFLMINIWTYAQPPGGTTGGSTGGDPPCWDPSCIPIDGGVAFLIIAGAALGIRKIYPKKTT